MELNATTRLTFPREQVFRAYRDEIVATVPYMANVRSIETRERVVDGPRVRMVNLWTGKTEIPSLARRFIDAEMFTWTDYATWDESAWKCEWRIETHALPGVLDCRGTTEFFPDGAGTEIRIRGNLVLHLEKARIPRLLAGTVQPVVERLIVGALKPNLLANGEAVEKFLLSRPRS